MANSAIEKAGDKLVDIQLIALGARKALYQIETEKSVRKVHLAIPFDPDDLFQVLREEFPDPRKSKEVDLPFDEN